MQFTMKRIEDYHEREMQEIEIKLRNKIHGYARACLETLGFELKTQLKFNFVQLEEMKTENLALKNKIARYEKDMEYLERQVVELTKFVKWEEIAHDQFTDAMKMDGIDRSAINTAANKQLTKKNKDGLKLYFEELKKEHDESQKQILDLSKPFALYNNSIRLSTFEKLNLLERETI